MAKRVAESIVEVSGECGVERVLVCPATRSMELRFLYGMKKQRHSELAPKPSDGKAGRLREELRSRQVAPDFLICGGRN
jgi:hypothetical protein